MVLDMVLSVYYAVQSILLIFESVDEILKCDHIKESCGLGSTFLWCYLLYGTKWK